MEEKNIKDRALDVAQAINSEFIKNSTLPRWNSYSATSKFKSIRRAIKRGHVDLILGLVYPDRPFNNRKSTAGRCHNQIKREIYGRVKRIQ